MSVFRFHLRQQFLLLTYSAILIFPSSVLSNTQSTPSSPAEDQNESIKVGLVSCTSSSQHDNPSNELVKLKTLIELIIVSAHDNHVALIELHIFLDDRKLKTAILKEVQEFKIKFQDVIVEAYTYWTEDAIKISKLTLNGNCQLVKFVFPEIFPTMAKILYVDVETTFTGSIQKVWNQFDQMEEQQICGMVGKNKVADKDNEKWREGGKYVSPREVSIGIMLMRLARMRDFGWEEKLISIYDEYRLEEGDMVDEALLSLFAQDYPEGLKIISPNEFQR